MQMLTKWGLFVGNKEDCDDFVKEMTRRENPVKVPEKSETLPETPKASTEAKKPSPRTTANTRKKTPIKRSAK